MNFERRRSLDFTCHVSHLLMQAGGYAIRNDTHCENGVPFRFGGASAPAWGESEVCEWRCSML